MELASGELYLSFPADILIGLAHAYRDSIALLMHAADAAMLTSNLRESVHNAMLATRMFNYLLDTRLCSLEL